MAISAVSCRDIEAPVSPEEGKERQPALGSVVLSSTFGQPSDIRMRLSGDDTDGFDLVWDSDDAITAIPIIPYLWVIGLQYMLLRMFSHLLAVAPQVLWRIA